MKINAKYRLTAAPVASKEAKEFIKMVKAADELSDFDVAKSKAIVKFVFNYFYKKKYNKQQLVSICVDALCNILNLNAIVEREFYGKVTELTKAKYHQLIRSMLTNVDHNHAHHTELFIIYYAVIRDFDALIKALYEAFKEYIVKTDHYRHYWGLS